MVSQTQQRSSSFFPKESTFNFTILVEFLLWLTQVAVLLIWKPPGQQLMAPMAHGCNPMISGNCTSGANAFLSFGGVRLTTSR
mmetsp:Transcript_34459/g.80717  ORF Transcript_34459/g.80717 Transcript_34459/m.80717 type:complete len:83 (+) Transcript_34459:1089-1337(+)